MSVSGGSGVSALYVLEFAKVSIDSNFSLTWVHIFEKSDLSGKFL